MEITAYESFLRCSGNGRERGGVGGASPSTISLRVRPRRRKAVLDSVLMEGVLLHDAGDDTSTHRQRMGRTFRLKTRGDMWSRHNETGQWVLFAACGGEDSIERLARREGFTIGERAYKFADGLSVHRRKAWYAALRVAHSNKRAPKVVEAEARSPLAATASPSSPRAPAETTARTATTDAGRRTFDAQLVDSLLRTVVNMRKLASMPSVPAASVSAAEEYHPASGDELLALIDAHELARSDVQELAGCLELDVASLCALLSTTTASTSALPGTALPRREVLLPGDAVERVHFNRVMAESVACSSANRRWRGARGLSAAVIDALFSALAPRESNTARFDVIIAGLSILVGADADAVAHGLFAIGDVGLVAHETGDAPRRWRCGLASREKVERYFTAAFHLLGIVSGSVGLVFTRCTPAMLAEETTERCFNDAPLEPVLIDGEVAEDSCRRTLITFASFRTWSRGFAFFAHPPEREGRREGEERKCDEEEEEKPFQKDVVAPLRVEPDLLPSQRAALLECESEITAARKLLSAVGAVDYVHLLPTLESIKR